MTGPWLLRLGMRIPDLCSSQTLISWLHQTSSERLQRG